MSTFSRAHVSIWSLWGKLVALLLGLLWPEGAKGVEYDVAAFEAPVWDCSIEGSKYVRWKAAIGDDAGDPAVHGNYIVFGTICTESFLNEHTGEKALVCIDANDGQLRWASFHEQLQEIAFDHPRSALRCKPIVDNERVYYISNRGELACVDLLGFRDNENDGPYRDETAEGDLDADIVWQLDMRDEFGVFRREAGMFGSPGTAVLHSAEGIFCLTGNGTTLGYTHHFPNFPFVPNPRAPSFLLVRPADGKVLWESDVSSKEVIYGQWSRPIRIDFEDAHYIVFPGGDGRLYAFEEITQKLAWVVDCNEPSARPWKGDFPGSRLPILSAPTYSGGQIYAALSLGKEVNQIGPPSVCAVDVARAAAGRGEDAVIWRFRGDRVDSYDTTPVVVGPYVFVYSQAGILYALDRVKGTTTHRFGLGDENSFFASPFLYRDLLYVPTGDAIFVIHVDEEVRFVGRYSFDRRILSTPTIRGSTMYVAIHSQLVAVKLTDSLNDD